jgi:hypothetical protein
MLSNISQTQLYDRDFALWLEVTARCGSPGIMGKNVHHVTNSQKMGYDGLIISG